MHRIEDRYLTWEEMESCVDEYHEKGMTQFIGIYSKYKDNQVEFKFGDELEYTLLEFNDDNKTITPSLTAKDVLMRIKNNPKHSSTGHFQLELFKYQFESTPYQPFVFKELPKVEECMLKSAMCNTKNDTAVFGEKDCKDNEEEPFYDKYLLSRISYLNANMYKEVFGEKKLKVPIMQTAENKAEYFEMDFTVETSSFQVTIQPGNLLQARRLFDNLLILCPIMLSLGAATPILKGYLVETNTRWSACVLSAQKTRPGFAEANFISPNSEKYNDILPHINNSMKQLLVQNGMCTMVPMFLKSSNLQSSKEKTNLFENMQGVFYKPLRMKSPLHKDECWRCEFRVCDVQLTDFENAALVTFIVLFAKMTLHFDIDLRILISKHEENMRTSQHRKSIGESRFWFRNLDNTNKSSDPNCLLLSIDEIVNGKEGDFVGLIPFIKKFLWKRNHINISEQNKINEHLEYISGLASGRILTAADWMRDFVTSHEEYSNDSVVTTKIAWDLCQNCERRRSDYIKSCLESSLGFVY